MLLALFDPASWLRAVAESKWLPCRSRQGLSGSRRICVRWSYRSTAKALEACVTVTADGELDCWSKRCLLIGLAERAGAAAAWAKTLRDWRLGKWTKCWISYVLLGSDHAMLLSYCKEVLLALRASCLYCVRTECACTSQALLKKEKVASASSQKSYRLGLRFMSSERNSWCVWSHNRWEEALRTKILGLLALHACMHMHTMRVKPS